MADSTIVLTEREHDYLSRLVDRAFGEVRVEARRTHHTPDYRQSVLEEEKMLRDLIAKFNKKA